MKNNTDCKCALNKTHTDLFECIAGYPDNNLKDVDLLGTIGNPLPIGVSLTKGPYTKPAFHFRSGANVGRFARYIFPKGFFKEFSISVVIRPKSAERGVVFALLPHIRRGNVILGLEIHRDPFSEGTTISLIHANNGNTRTVFDFTVPSLTGKWTWLSFSIRNNGVTFYKDCREVDTKFLPAALGNFTLRPYSALYIGRAGWTPGASSSAFQVSMPCLDGQESVSSVIAHITRISTSDTLLSFQTFRQQKLT